MRKLLILMLLTASICWGQAATLMTIPHQHFHDNDGNLCASCTVTTYTASTSTPTSTYTSKTGLVTNTNPITLNSRGEPTSDGVSASSIYIKAGTCLKLVLKDSAGTTISTEDGICSDPASPVSLTANNAGGYGWSLTQSSGTGGGVNIVPGADSGTGEEAFRIRNAANNATKFQIWGDGTWSSASNGSVGGTFAVTGAQTNSSTISATRYTSTIATGTSPLVVASKTPVTNLHSYPVAYTPAGVQNTDFKFVTGSSTLSAGTVTVTLTSSAVMSGINTYLVIGTNNTNANAFKIVNVSGSQFTITGTGTDVISWMAFGL